MAFNLEDYEPVASRINRFYTAHPDGRIITELVHYLADVAVFKAEIYIGDVLVATGWEEEVRNSNHINKASHLASPSSSRSRSRGRRSRGAAPRSARLRPPSGPTSRASLC